MLRSDFEACLASLRAFYGPETYTDHDQLAKLWRFASPLNKRDFDAVILELSLAHPKAPTVAAICAACAAKQREIAQRQKATANAEYSAAERLCRDCLGSGMICAVSRTPPHYEYAFRCGCGAADRRQLSRELPSWREELASELVKARCPAEAHKIIREEGIE